MRSRVVRLAWIVPAVVMSAGSLVLGAAIGGPGITLDFVMRQLADNGGPIGFILVSTRKPLPTYDIYRSGAQNHHGASSMSVTNEPSRCP